MEKPLEGKVALLTAAGSSIGRAVALAYAACGTRRGDATWRCHGKEAQRRTAGKVPGINGAVRLKAYMDAPGMPSPQSMMTRR